MTIVKSSELEIIEFFYNEEYKHQWDQDLYRIFEINPFVYPSNVLNIKKIVMIGEAAIKDISEKIIILTFKTEQEFLIDNENSKSEKDKEFVEKLLLKAYTFFYLKYAKVRTNHSVKITDAYPKESLLFVPALLSLLEWKEGS